MARHSIETIAIDKKIGKRIKELRIARGLSRVQLAALIAVTQQQLQKYENASNRISAGRLVVIATALGVSVNYFFDNIATFMPLETAHERLGMELSRIFLKIKNPQQQVALVALARTLH